jgi:putative lipoic acid-binding regulatory protein
MTTPTARQTNTGPAQGFADRVPSQFPIKVMGVKNEHLVHEITKIAEKFDPSFDASTVELRPSSGGNYLGVTITITATSREQLDDLPRTDLSPLVKVVL